MFQQLKRQFDNMFDFHLYEPCHKKRRTTTNVVGNKFSELAGKCQSTQTYINSNDSSNDSSTWNLMEADFDVDIDIDDGSDQKIADRNIICGLDSDIDENTCNNSNKKNDKKIITVKVNKQGKKKFYIDDLIRLSWFKKREMELYKNDCICINDISIKWKMIDLRYLIKSAEVESIYLPYVKPDIQSLESLIECDEYFNKDKCLITIDKIRTFVGSVGYGNLYKCAMNSSNTKIKTGVCRSRNLFEVMDITRKIMDQCDADGNVTMHS